MVQTITSITGNTPLVRLSNISRELGTSIFAKLEFYNPAGSVKCRVARAMISRAEKEGKIDADTVIIEPTSGNTGLGLAFVCAAKNYRLILTMPDTMSIERRQFLAHAGVETVLTDGEKGMKGCIEKAKQLVDEHKNSFMPMQFENPANPKVHEETTGPEIWKSREGNIDIFIAGVGTGGTITGVSRYLKNQKKILTVAVEPYGSPILSKGVSGKHKIQGIGAGFVPPILDTTLIDEIITITDEEAFRYMKVAAQKDGIFCGISSGAALAAAVKYAECPQHKGKNIVTLFPDSVDRYLSVLAESAPK
jgi:cysteine synthase